MLTNIKVNRSYFITATAPQGYLFTYGICNDDIAGWECDHQVRRLNRAERYVGKGGRFLQEVAVEAEGTDEAAGLALTPTEAENSLGISTGRSTKCISVDKSGFADGTLDLGVMRLGDSKEAVTKVALLLDFDDAVASANQTSGAAAEGRDRHRNLHRNLIERQIREQLLRGVQRGSITVHPHPDSRGRTRYLLGEEDKAAIGSVTAEVLAGTLDGRLAENGIELDAVLPKEVLISNKSEDRGGGADEKSAKDGLAVAMEIRGHYSPPPEIDFDYIVQDSINRDTETIRRGLRDYNQNCREQTTMVQEEGYSEQDFAEIHSTSGARPNRGKSSNSKTSSASSSSLPSDSVFRTACAQGNNLPDYFETSLKQIQARQVSELDSLADYSNSIIYMNEEARLESWAMGPIAALAGLIVLLMGAFVFRRAMGPRRLDVYKDANKTKRVDTDGRRKFGEAAGPTDDGSVDSAFYSEDDAFSDDHDKRHKRKHKDLQKGKSLRNYERGENGDAEGPHDHHRHGHHHTGKRRSSTRNIKAPGKKRSERKLTKSLASNRSLRSERSDRSQQSSEPMRLSASTRSEDTESLESLNQRSVESLNNHSQGEVEDEGTVEGAASTESTSHGHKKRKKKSKHGNNRRNSDDLENDGSRRKSSSRSGSSRDLTAEEGGGKKKKKKDRKSNLNNDTDGEVDIV